MPSNRKYISATNGNLNKEKDFTGHFYSGKSRSDIGTNIWFVKNLKENIFKIMAILSFQNIWNVTKLW